MTACTPRHKAHPWSAIRELRAPNLPPRHARPDRIIERLGADAPEIAELFADITIRNPFRGVR